MNTFAPTSTNPTLQLSNGDVNSCVIMDDVLYISTSVTTPGTRACQTRNLSMRCHI